jgi:hypothetical protein
MSRPANFTGFTSVVSNATGNPLTAVDWNTFTDRIVAFALYKFKGNDIGSFSSVSAGQNFTAGMFNSAVSALNTIGASGVPSAKSSGNDLYASYIQALKMALNSIT